MSNYLLGKKVAVFPSSQAQHMKPILGAKVIAQDESGIVIHYVWTATPQTSFMPWSAIGRVEVMEVAR